MNKRQMKKQAKRKMVKDVYLEEDVYFGDSPTAIEIVEVDEDHNVVQYANDNWNELLEANDKEERIGFVKKNGVISIGGNLARTGITAKGERIELDDEVTKVVEYPKTTRFDEVGLSEKASSNKQVINITKSGTTEEEQEAIKRAMELIREHEKQLNIDPDDLYTAKEILVNPEDPEDKMVVLYSKEELKKRKDEILSNLDKTLNEHLYAEPEKPKGFFAKIKSFFKKG